MSRRRLAIVAAALGVGALLLLWGWRATGDEPGSLTARRFAWPPGLVRRYQLVADGRAVTPSPADDSQLRGEAHTEATLELRGYGERDGRVVVGLRLSALGPVRMTLLGGAAAQDRAALEAALVGPEAFLSFLPTGDLAEVAFAADTNNVFKGLAELVAGELQAPLRAEPSWTLLESTTRGKAQTRFTLSGDTLTKVRERYATLVGFGRGGAPVTVEGQTTITLSAQAHPLRVTSHERLRAGPVAESVQDLSLVFLGEGAFDGQWPAVALVPAPLDEAPAPLDAREQVMAQRIAGLTEAELFEGLESYGAAHTLPNLGLFMGRASGLLLKHPELCGRLAERAANPATPAAERTFALELLAAAGSPTAQGAMREVLDSENVRADPLGRRAFLRTTLLKRPTPETVAFVGERYQGATGTDKQTLGLALGATAGLLARQGKPELAARHLDGLRAELASARDTTAKEHLLAALGNAGLEPYVPDVVRFTKDPEPLVRVQALDALRKTTTPEVRSVVKQAASDPDPRVVVAAVELLGGFDPDASERQAIIDAVRQGRVPPRDLGTAIGALERFVADPQVRALFLWLSVQQALDPSQRTRVRNLLEGVAP